MQIWGIFYGRVYHGYEFTAGAVSDRRAGLSHRRDQGKGHRTGHGGRAAGGAGVRPLRLRNARADPQRGPGAVCHFRGLHRRPQVFPQLQAEREKLYIIGLYHHPHRRFDLRAAHRRLRRAAGADGGPDDRRLDQHARPGGGAGRGGRTERAGGHRLRHRLSLRRGGRGAVRAADAQAFEGGHEKGSRGHGSGGGRERARLWGQDVQTGRGGLFLLLRGHRAGLSAGQHRDPPGQRRKGAGVRAGHHGRAACWWACSLATSATSAPST